MNQQALSEALDRAIVRVADSEMKRLSYGISQPERNEKIRYTLDAFRHLQQGVPPDYNDPWVPLFYLSWYQAGQIQLAYQQIKAVNRARVESRLAGIEKTPLRIVDFGCGTLALKFAIAWVFAEALEQSARSIPLVRIYCYDQSDMMIGLGECLWEQFKKEVENNPELNHFSTSMKAIKSCSSISELLSKLGPRDERWLCAMHVVYKPNPNTPDAKAQLGEFFEELSPDVGLLTSHGDHDSEARLKSASPFREGEYSVSQIGLKSDITLTLPKVTTWRKALNDQICPPHYFLNNPVNWGFQNSFGLIYTKPV